MAPVHWIRSFSMPGTWTAMRSLDVRLLWALLGIPICIWFGVVWDAFQAPNKTQTFLGAANNAYLLWIVPVALKDLVKMWVKGLPKGRPLALLSFFLVAWALWGLSLNGRLDTLNSAILPAVAIVCLGAFFVLWDAAHAAWRQGHGPALQRAFQGVAVWALAGLLAGVAVHLLGPWPKHQIFLFADGFGNVRTLGETAALLGAVALVTALFQGGIFWRVAAVLAIAALAWSGTRAGWVGFVGAFLFLSFFWSSPIARGAQVLAALVLGFALSLPLPTPDSSYGALRVGHLWTETQNAATSLPLITEIPGEDKIDGSNRVALWNWGVERIAESPWIGLGYGAMGDIPDKPAHAYFMHLHNFPLDLAFGMGVPVALLVVLALIATVFSAALRARRDGLWVLPTAACTVLLTALFAGIFFFPITVVTVALGLGGAWAGTQGQEGPVDAEPKDASEPSSADTSP